MLHRAKNKKTSWRNIVAFPESLSDEIIRLLDTLEELVPIPKVTGRKDAFPSWLARGEEQGVVDEVERLLTLEATQLSLHEQPDPMFLSMFANGDDDLLYEEAARERYQEAVALLPRKKELLRLSDEHNYVVIEPTTKRTGIVVESNLLGRGREVRSRVNWSFAVKPRNSWSSSTLVAPRTLEILDAPKRRSA